jgi:hypothetical protein
LRWIGASEDEKGESVDKIQARIAANPGLTISLSSPCGRQSAVG